MLVIENQQLQLKTVGNGNGKPATLARDSLARQAVPEANRTQQKERHLRSTESQEEADREANRTQQKERRLRASHRVTGRGRSSTKGMV